MGRAGAPKRVPLNPADIRVVLGAFALVSSGGGGARMWLDGRPDHKKSMRAYSCPLPVTIVFGSAYIA